MHWAARHNVVISVHCQKRAFILSEMIIIEGNELFLASNELKYDVNEPFEIKLKCDSNTVDCSDEYCVTKPYRKWTPKKQEDINISCNRFHLLLPESSGCLSVNQLLDVSLFMGKLKDFYVTKLELLLLRSQETNRDSWQKNRKHVLCRGFCQQQRRRSNRLPIVAGKRYWTFHP